MSVILTGPRRIYVVLLFWQRLTEPCFGCPRARFRIDHPAGAGQSATGVGPCGSVCRLVLSIRAQRIFWKRLIGLSLLVLDPNPEGRT
jgi:hypothetical protein